MLNDYLKRGVRKQIRVILFGGFLVLKLPLLAIPNPAVMLAWDASTDPDVTGYNVYYGSSSRNYTNVIPAGSSTTAAVSNLQSGVTYYFAATTYTATGLESDYSAEASYSVAPANFPPTLDVLTNLTIPQDSGQQIVTLTGISSGSTNEIQTLTVSAFSSNPGLIPNPGVVYSSPDTNGTLTFTSTAGSFGSAVITVLVDDGGAVSNTLIRSFTVNVVPANNPPTIDSLANIVVNENGGPQNISLTGISSGSAIWTSNITVTAASSNPTLVPTPSIIYSNDASAGVLALSPITNSFGTAKITVTVQNDQPTNNTTSVSFQVIVNQTLFTQALLTNAIVAPNTTFKFQIPPPTNYLNFNMYLAAGAPSGAKITTRKGISWLVWTPNKNQASTTNQMNVVMICPANPLLNTNGLAQVAVLDCLGIGLGSTTLQAGQSGTIPIILSSSDGVTNLSFNVAWPSNSLLNPTLSISAAGIATSSLNVQGTNLAIMLQTLPGQPLQGSNVIGFVNFQVSPSQPSGYINLPVNNVTAYKATALPYVVSFPTAGQIAVVNAVAMLQATTLSGSTRSLIVMGRVGNSYQLQYCTNLGPDAVWAPLLTYSQTNVSQSFNVDPSLSQVFYRVQQR
jgi:hypothetical protein